MCQFWWALLLFQTGLGRSLVEMYQIKCSLGWFDSLDLCGKEFDVLLFDVG